MQKLPGECSPTCWPKLRGCSLFDKVQAAATTAAATEDIGCELPSDCLGAELLHPTDNLGIGICAFRAHTDGVHGRDVKRPDAPHEGRVDLDVRASTVTQETEEVVEPHATVVAVVRPLPGILRDVVHGPDAALDVLNKRTEILGSAPAQSSTTDTKACHTHRSICMRVFAGQTFSRPAKRLMCLRITAQTCLQLHSSAPKTAVNQYLTFHRVILLPPQPR